MHDNGASSVCQSRELRSERRRRSAGDSNRTRYFRCRLTSNSIHRNCNCIACRRLCFAGFSSCLLERSSNFFAKRRPNFEQRNQIDFGAQNTTIQTSATQSPIFYPLLCFRLLVKLANTVLFGLLLKYKASSNPNLPYVSLLSLPQVKMRCKQRLRRCNARLS